MNVVHETGSHFDLDESSARRLLDDFLARPLFAHLSTASASGPRESSVWFLWEDDALWFIGNYKTDSFPKRIDRDPRCAVGIVDFDVSRGMVQHAGFRRRARLDRYDRDRMRRLLRRYLGDEQGWDARFVEILDDRDYVFVRFVAETVVVRDQSYVVKNKVTASSDRGLPKW